MQGEWHASFEISHSSFGRPHDIYALLSDAELRRTSPGSLISQQLSDCLSDLFVAASMTDKDNVREARFQESLPFAILSFSSSHHC